MIRSHGLRTTGLHLILGSDSDEYLCQHGVNVAVISMTVALHMGFKEDQVQEVTIGAMFHDLGMLPVPRSIRMGPRSLTQIER